MKAKRFLILAGIACVIAFLGMLWWGSWWLRGGPNGPNGWAFLPVTMTALAFAGCAMASFAIAASE